MMELTGPLHFYQLVYIGILSTTSYSWPASMINPQFNVKMTSRNFQHILSWKAGNNTTVPTYYRVKYSSFRSGEFQIAEECSNITHLFCDLSEYFTDEHENYKAMVQGFTGSKVFTSATCCCFIPYLDTYLGPPAVNITPYPDSINITTKLPASHLKREGKVLSLIDIYDELNYVITMRTSDAQVMTLKNTTTKEHFATVVEGLYPNANYCVSVAVTARINVKSIPSALKCVITGSINQQGYPAASLIGGVLVALVVCVILCILRRGGFIRLKTKKWPSVLKTTRNLGYSVCEPEPENVSPVQVVFQDVKKKVWDYNYGDDDDDDDDDDTGNNGAYTMHGIIRRDSGDHAEQNISVKHSMDCISTESSSQSNELLATDVENSGEKQISIKKNEDTSSKESHHPSLEENCSMASVSRNSTCFNINLNTVMLGDLEELWDDTSALISHQEDADDLPECDDSDALESKLFTDAVDVQKIDCHNISHEWQKSSFSDESDLSDSGTDQVTEYIGR
ncbi:PREDICTED: interferon alpha/beta receptor 2 isoform X2 [Gavialis gangeticus]|uniref:interferon alpha/beta receptor 2 isoform X2 n=1 Tax=Gavialis gangeticus TaxID=94835 RepID=UPI00092F8D25|nr:PREDICTED: interferon alpha/beta receptor 2 isoform X2 [Gavialis gangeticus]